MMKPQIITTFSQSVDLKLWQMWKSDAVHYNRTEAAGLLIQLAKALESRDSSSEEVITLSAFMVIYIVLD